MKKWIVLAVFSVMFVALGFTAVHYRFPIRYLDIIQENAGDLDTSLILAVIMVESSFRSGAQSHAGAQGLMQLMPATAEEMASHLGLTDFSPEDVWSPEINIALGTFYLNRLMNLHNGNIELALASYNAGQGNVRKWLSDPDISLDGKTLERIPFPETYNYLRRVRRVRMIYDVLLMFSRNENR